MADQAKSRDQVDDAEDGEAGAKAEVWPDFAWPAGGDLRLLARYVNQQSIRECGLAFRQGESAVDEAFAKELTTEDRQAVRRRAAERLFDRMAGSKGRFHYDYEPFNESNGQRIRGVWEAQTNKATCIDLALIYAGLCLTEGLYPLLVVLKGRGVKGHALVGVALDEDVRDYATRDPMFLPDDASGFAVARDGGQIDATSGAAVTSLCRERGICLIETMEVRHDITGAHTPDFARAVALATGHFQDDSMEKASFLDLPWLLAKPDYRPYQPRKGQWAIHNRFTPGPEYHPFPSRNDTLRSLQQASGLVVVYGPPGSGKSMLAREAAQGIDQGFGWELRADDRSTVAASLAAAEASEQGTDLEAEATEKADRTSMASDARTRLAGVKDRWVVLADNADGDPGEIIDALPMPQSKQLLLVTTTNSKWQDKVEQAHQRGIHAELVALGPIPEDELAQAFPHLGRALRSLDGRPLLARAFNQFHRATGRDPEDRTGSATPVAGEAGADEDRGELAARVLWQAARRELNDQGHEQATALEQAAALAAVLPPERVEHALLERVAPGAAKRLYELGLLDTTNEPGVGFLHRLFGSAIRSSVPGFDALLIDWYASGELHEVIDAYGSTPQVTDHAALLEAAAGTAPSASSAAAQQEATRTRLPENDIGLALVGAGRLVELYGLTGRSARLYELALPYLDPDRPDHRRPRAEAIHGVNRRVNQEKNPGRRRLVKASHDMDEAIALRHKHAESVAAELNPDDMQADWDYRMAQAETEASISLKVLMEAKVAGLDGDLPASQRALDRLKESAERRQQLLGDEHPLYIRGLYNVCGAQMRVGKSYGERTYFEAAMDTYDQVLQVRKRFHRRDAHPHIAACHHGKAIARYNEAVFVEAPPAVSRDDNRRKLQDLLNKAFGHASTGLALRQQVPRTPDALDDLTKSWSLLHKITRAQQLLAEKQYEEHQRIVLNDELDSEIRRLLGLIRLA